MSIYLPFPQEIDYNYRLTPQQIAKADIALVTVWKPFVATIQHAPGFIENWDLSATMVGGLYAIDVVAGELYEFSSKAYWAPSITVYDAAGFELSVSNGSNRYSLNSITTGFVAAETGRIYVQAYAQHSPVFANADLSIRRDVDNSKGTAGNDHFVRDAFQGVHTGFWGGAGNDLIESSVPYQTNYLYGGDGWDVIKTAYGSGSLARVDGGTGIDTLWLPSVSSASASLTAKGSGPFAFTAPTKEWLVVGSDTHFKGIEFVRFSDRTVSVADLRGYVAFTVDSDAGDYLRGDNLDNKIDADLGADELSGFGGNDTLSSGRGDDFLFGGAGNDHLTGGVGIDTALFAGSRANFTFELVDGALRARDRTGGEGVDTLVGIERAMFNDATISFETTGTAAQAFRLYKAVFDRAPDPAGLAFWKHQLASGLGVQQMAAELAKSQEFKTKFGDSPANADLLKAVYQNVLHRAADAAGYTFWLDALDKRVVSIPELIAAFSDSTENVAQVVGLMQLGYEVLG
ncbi:DUF4214 domain-containing protein [Massilia yuzhufengensis]|uniref:DUF4214 domain-containing protein n=1 Tax=Massilia yuzhufengensis TaxID=1164594 RepID=A0A1I1HMW5_9BURK|nr:DUF4214 domain-containing protein [Massilia yuzhufengensis]SFC23328.1 protein of unknown function [Massilia yuzhufengensis]